MATHVDSVADIPVPAVSHSEFMAEITNGDLIFTSGAEAVSHIIEGETKSPWSHVGMIWIMPGFLPLFMESVHPQGVRISRLEANYIGAYDGDICLARRDCLSMEGIAAIQAKFLTILGDPYDVQSEVGQLAHSFIGTRVEAPRGQYYCSGAQWYASTAWSPALQFPEGQTWLPTPEQNWTDPTVLPVCKLLKGQK